MKENEISLGEAEKEILRDLKEAVEIVDKAAENPSTAEIEKEVRRRIEMSQKGGAQGFNK